MAGTSGNGIAFAKPRADSPSVSGDSFFAPTENNTVNTGMLVCVCVCMCVYVCVCVCMCVYVCMYMCVFMSEFMCNVCKQIVCCEKCCVGVFFSL